MSGTDHNWSRQIKNSRNYEKVIFSKVEGLQTETLLPALLLYGYSSSMFCTFYLRNIYSGKHILVAVSIYVICETCKPLREPPKIRANEKKVKFTALLQINYLGVLVPCCTSLVCSQNYRDQHGIRIIPSVFMATQHILYPFIFKPYFPDKSLHLTL